MVFFGAGAAFYNTFSGYTNCGQSINWGNVAAQTLIGGLAGALNGATPKGLGQAGLVDATASALSEAANSYFNGSGFSLGNAVFGAAGSIVGGLPGQRAQFAIFNQHASPAKPGSAQVANAVASGIGGAAKALGGAAGAYGAQGAANSLGGGCCC